MTIKYIVLLFATIIIAQADITTPFTTDYAPELTTEASTTDKSTTFSTASTSEPTTGTSSTASTPLSSTKWHSSSVTPIIITSTPTSKSPINEAVVLYNQLKLAVQKALLQTRTFVQQFFRSSITFTSNTIKDTFKIFFQFSQQLNKLNQEYVKLGIDISNCLELIEPDFSKLPLTLANQLSRCITPEIDVVTNHLFATVRNVTTLWDVVLELGIKLDNCGTNSYCITELISQMTVEFVKIPTTISTDLLTLQEYLNKSTATMGTCTESKISAATANGTEAIKIVSDCARNVNV